MPESVKELTVRLAFEHGDTKSQIAAIRNEIKLLDSGFQAAAMTAGGFSGALNESATRADMLRQQIALQEEAQRRYGEAIQKTGKALQENTAKHEEQAQKLEAARQKKAELMAQTEQLQAAMAAEKKANGDNTMAYLEMDQQLDALNASMAETEAEITRLESAHQRSGNAIVKNEKALQNLTAAQNLAKAAEGQLRRELTETERRVKANADKWEELARKQRAYADAAKGAGQQQMAAGRALSRGTAAIVAAGVAAGKAAIDWESSFAGVRKTVSGTEEQLRDLEQALLDMEVPTSFSELADIAANAGQLGIATDNVAGFTRTMADLAETTDLTAEAAASSFAQYANITRMPQENISNLGSVTVALGNNLATTESKIVDFATAIAAAGSQAGMTDQQIFGISGGLASLGLEAQAGGTAFSKAIINMKVAAETGSEDLREFAAVAGMSADEFKRAFAEDAAGTFIKFVQGLSTGGESAVVMLDKMGITEVRLRDTLLRASNASELLTKSVDMANAAWTENTALTDEAAVRYNTTASRMQMLGKQAQKTAMGFGQAILPSLETGMDGISKLIDKFNALDDAQKQNIVRWAAYAAAVGPALMVLGKANTMFGGMMGKLSEFSTALANGSGGLQGVLGALGGLLGPAGMLALAAGAGVAAYHLYDVASGAKAAREAAAALRQEAEDWAGTQAKTLYDTGTGDPLARFGLSRDDFSGSTIREAQDWMSELVAVWTDGKAETNAIVQQFADGFSGASDGVREAIQGQRELLDGYEALTPEARAQMDADLKQLDDWDSEVAALLKKRQNGMLTDEEQARLSEIVQQRGEIEVRYSLDTDSGYEQILTQMESALERARAAGADNDASLYGDTLNALAEGRRAYNAALEQSYDAEYAQIRAIEDESARMAALEALNESYNQRRLDGEEAYADAVRTAGVEAWQAGGYTEQIAQLDQLAAKMGDLENLDLTDIADFAAGLDEGKMASMVAMIEQLKAAGLSDGEMADLGIDFDDIMAKIEAVRDAASSTEGLEGISDMFGTALPEEIQRIMIGLDMTQAAADWEAFASGGSLTAIKAGVEVDESTTIELTGTVTDLAKAPGARFTVDAQGNITGVETAEGVTYTVDGSGNITGATTAEGVTFTVDGSGRVTTASPAAGVRFEVDGDGRVTNAKPDADVTFTVNGDGTVSSVVVQDGVTYTVDGNGSITSVTTAEGLTYTIDGNGNVTSVQTAEGVKYTVNGDGTVTRVTLAEGVKLPELSASARITLNPLDQAAITAWENANKGVQITGPRAKVGVALGANWASELKAAYDAGLLAVYGADGAKLDVTPEVLSQITAADVAMVDEDGTLHVVITPEVGSSEGVAASTEQMNTTPMTGTIFEGLATDTQQAVDGILSVKGALEETRAAMERWKSGTQTEDETPLAMLSDAEPQQLNAVQTALQGLSETDLSNIASQAANLMAALNSGELDEGTAQAYADQLQSIVDLVTAADQYLGAGNNVSAGIAQGMTAYGWSGDAASLATSLVNAIDGALGAHSPATALVPTGSDVGEGIAQGMTQFSYATTAAQVCSAIVSGFSGLPAQGTAIGRQFGAGLDNGLSARLPAIVAKARSAANQIAAAFREAWQIHSPSRVAENLTEMFGRGLENGMDKWPTISERLLQDDLETLYRGARRAEGSSETNTYNNNNSVNLNVERLEVSDQRDAAQLAAEINSINQRKARARGLRR